MRRFIMVLVIVAISLANRFRSWVHQIWQRLVPRAVQFRQRIWQRLVSGTVRFWGWVCRVSVRIWQCLVPKDLRNAIWRGPRAWWRKRNWARQRAERERARRRIQFERIAIGVMLVVIDIILDVRYGHGIIAWHINRQPEEWRLWAKLAPIPWIFLLGFWSLHWLQIKKLWNPPTKPVPEPEPPLPGWPQNQDGTPIRVFDLKRADLPRFRDAYNFFKMVFEGVLERNRGRQERYNEAQKVRVEAAVFLARSLLLTLAMELILYAFFGAAIYMGSNYGEEVAYGLTIIVFGHLMGMLGRAFVAGALGFLLGAYLLGAYTMGPVGQITNPLRPGQQAYMVTDLRTNTALARVGVFAGSAIAVAVVLWFLVLLLEYHHWVLAPIAIIFHLLGWHTHKLASEELWGPSLKKIGEFMAANLGLAFGILALVLVAPMLYYYSSDWWASVDSSIVKTLPKGWSPYVPAALTAIGVATAAILLRLRKEIGAIATSWAFLLAIVIGAAGILLFLFGGDAWTLVEPSIQAKLPDGWSPNLIFAIVAIMGAIGLLVISERARLGFLPIIGGLGIILCGAIYYRHELLEGIRDFSYSMWEAYDRNAGSVLPQGWNNQGVKATIFFAAGVLGFLVVMELLRRFLRR